MEYLQNYFSIEREIDKIKDEVCYHSINISMYNYALISEDYNSVISTEAISDVISLHKSKILIFIKKCISELIKIILEFFGLTTNNKKIFLMMSKNFDKYRKSLVETFTERNERKGPYNFSEKPITIRNPYSSIYRPVQILSYLTLGITADIGSISELTTKNKISNLPELQFSQPGELEVLSKNLANLYAVSIKAIYIIAMMISADVFLIDDSLKGYAKFSSIDQNVIIDDPFVVTGIDSFKEVTLSDEKIKSFIENLLAKFGLDMSAKDYSIKKILGIIKESNVDTNSLSIIDSWYREDKSELFKNMNEVGASLIQDTLEDLKDIDEIDIESPEMFELICINGLISSKKLADIYKNIDVSKELDKMKKALDKVNKYVGTLDDLQLSVLNSIYNINKYITATTYMYNICKSNLNKFIKEMIRLVDNGLTDIKKLEATIA